VSFVTSVLMPSLLMLVALYIYFTVNAMLVISVLIVRLFSARSV
jgi:hypothetical protein